MILLEEHELLEAFRSLCSHLPEVARQTHAFHSLGAKYRCVLEGAFLTPLSLLPSSPLLHAALVPILGLRWPASVCKEDERGAVGSWVCCTSDWR